MNKSLVIILILFLIVSGLLWRRAQQKQPTNLNNTITVGTNAEFPPFSFKQNDEIVGFDIDVIAEVIHRMNKKMIIKDMSFDILLPGLQLNEFDIVAAGVTPTAERAQRVLFTKPHIENDELAIINLATRTPIKNIDDLQGKNVVVNEGYTADTYISQYKNINITRLSSASVIDGILAIKSGSTDAFISALTPLKPYFDKIGKTEFHITPLEDAQEKSAFAISKSKVELRDYIQTLLDAMEADGTLTKLKKKWDLI